MPPSSSSKSSARTLSAFASALAARGLDLVQTFDVARYNDKARVHPSLRPVVSFGREHALAYAIGNTRALWPLFLSSYQHRDELRAAHHPLDTYVAEAVRECVALLEDQSAIYFAHDTGARLVSMVTMADASDLAPRGPAQLAVHRVHGPWIGLRALVVVDADPPPSSTPAPRACDDCAAPCVPALERALAATTDDARAAGDLRETWRAWVAVRDACPVGRESRYGEAQLRYHYTKDRASLTG